MHEILIFNGISLLSWHTAVYSYAIMNIVVSYKCHLWDYNYELMLTYNYELICILMNLYSISFFKIHFPRNKYRIGFTKNLLSVSNHISYFILNVITSYIYIDNGVKVKTDSGWSHLIEYETYFKESEY